MFWHAGRNDFALTRLQAGEIKICVGGGRVTRWTYLYFFATHRQNQRQRNGCEDRHLVSFSASMSRLIFTPTYPPLEYARLFTCVQLSLPIPGLRYKPVNAAETIHHTCLKGQGPHASPTCYSKPQSFVLTTATNIIPKTFFPPPNFTFARMGHWLGAANYYELGRWTRA